MALIPHLLNVIIGIEKNPSMPVSDSTIAAYKAVLQSYRLPALNPEYLGAFLSGERRVLKDAVGDKADRAADIQEGAAAVRQRLVVDEV